MVKKSLMFSAIRHAESGDAIKAMESIGQIVDEKIDKYIGAIAKAIMVDGGVGAVLKSIESGTKIEARRNRISKFIEGYLGKIAGEISSKKHIMKVEKIDANILKEALMKDARYLDEVHSLLKANRKADIVKFTVEYLTTLKTR